MNRCIAAEENRSLTAGVGASSAFQSNSRGFPVLGSGRFRIAFLRGSLDGVNCENNSVGDDDSGYEAWLQNARSLWLSRFASALQIITYHCERHRGVTLDGLQVGANRHGFVRRLARAEYLSFDVVWCIADPLYSHAVWRPTCVSIVRGVRING
jgi:hypothetical protein